MLAGKTVVLGVSGGIAAYKSAEIVRWLKKERAAVIVVMTPAAKQFISPLTLATLSGNPVLDDLWAPNQMLTFGRPRERTSPVEHIEIADAADLVIVAPATADLLERQPGALERGVVLAAEQRLHGATSAQLQSADLAGDFSREHGGLSNAVRIDAEFPQLGGQLLGALFFPSEQLSEFNEGVEALAIGAVKS